MDQLDMVNREKLVAALRFGMQTSTEHPSKATYQEGIFQVDISYQNNQVTVIVSYLDDVSRKKNVDHSLSDMASQFLKQKILSVRMEKSMSRKSGTK